MLSPITFSISGLDDFMNADSVPLQTVKLIEGKPLGLDHPYFERKEKGVKAGIWRSSAYTEWYEYYPCDEFMYVISGHVFVENCNFSHCYDEGIAFLIPKGFKGYWRQSVEMVKYYMIVE